MHLSFLRKFLFLFLCISISFFYLSSLSAQDKEGTESEQPSVRPPRTDLPFEISEKKRLRERDLKIKKEGGYITGLPLLNSDPNNGIGYGVRVFYYYNGERS